MEHRSLQLRTVPIRTPNSRPRANRPTNAMNLETTPGLDDDDISSDSLDFYRSGSLPQNLGTASEHDSSSSTKIEASLVHFVRGAFRDVPTSQSPPASLTTDRRTFSSLTMRSRADKNSLRFQRSEASMVSTISRDNTAGLRARHAQLLATYGKKTTPNMQESPMPSSSRQSPEPRINELRSRGDARTEYMGEDMFLADFLNATRTKFATNSQHQAPQQHEHRPPQRINSRTRAIRIASKLMLSNAADQFRGPDNIPAEVREAITSQTLRWLKDLGPHGQVRGKRIWVRQRRRLRRQRRIQDLEYRRG